MCIPISDNAISYLAPSKFISRQDELRLEKPKKELDVAQSGSSLVVRDRAAEQSCDVTTALSLHHALQRRALAMDLVGLSTFGRAQSWNDFFMSHLEEQPMAGHGHQPPASLASRPSSLAQVGRDPHSRCSQGQCRQPAVVPLASHP